MSNYSFSKDLLRAKKTEIEFTQLAWSDEIGLFSLCPLDMEISTGKNSDYDVKVIFGEDKESFSYTFEIKEDFYCKKSGNVAVEFECRGKSSGISVSKADFYVYKLHTAPKGEIIWISVPREHLADVCQYMIEDSNCAKRIRHGGDKGSGTGMVLFSLGEFLQLGEIFHVEHTYQHFNVGDATPEWLRQLRIKHGT